MTQDSTGVGGAIAAAGAGAHRPRSLKAKAAEEFRRFFLLFLYLWILFGVFVLNQDVVLREHGINLAMQGFAFINALVFAKVMMLFEIFDPGRWLRKRPLIYPILYETLLLTSSFSSPTCLRRRSRGCCAARPSPTACLRSAVAASWGCSASPRYCLSR
jgi:hypothetical protein